MLPSVAAADWRARVRAAVHRPASPPHCRRPALSLRQKCRNFLQYRAQPPATMLESLTQVSGTDVAFVTVSLSYGGVSEREKFMIRRLTTSIGVILALGTAMASAAANIDNTTGGSPFSIQPFGSINSATYGQTFVAGGTSISSFSLFLNGRADGSGPLDIKGYLGSWDGTKLASVLYTSGIQTANDGPLTEYAFSTGNVALTAGNTYVAFLSISDLAVQPQSLFNMPAATDNIAGSFVYQNNGTNFGSLSSDNWITFHGRDVYFKANFDAVPEPASWILMIGGFGLVGGTMRRRAAVRPHTA